MIQKSSLSAEDKAGLHDEISILVELKSPLIMRLYEVYDAPKTYQLVTELVEGGELFDRIVEKEKYSEADARAVVRNMVSAIDYIHGHNVVHRDLKPENILLVSPDDDAQIKLADFGFAKHVYEATSACGTPGFVAPEILKGNKYGTGVDVWSLGVIVYITLVGYPPFYDENQSRLFEKIKSGRYAFHKKYWSDISENAKDFVRAMLTVDPTCRAAASALLAHPWLAPHDEHPHVELGHSLRHLRQAADAGALAFEKDHAPTGPHIAPHEHDDYHTHVEGREAAADA